MEERASSRGMTIRLYGGHNLDREPGQLHCPPTMIWVGTSEVDLRTTREQQGNQQLTLQHSIALPHEEIFLDKTCVTQAAIAYELSHLNRNSFAPFLSCLFFSFFSAFFPAFLREWRAAPRMYLKGFSSAERTCREQSTKDFIAENQFSNRM